MLFWKLRYVCLEKSALYFVYLFFFCVKMKYKEAGKKGVSSALYSTLPETLETQHAKEASELQSQVPQFTHQPSLRGIKALLFPHGANFEELLLLSSNYYLVVGIKFSQIRLVLRSSFFHLRKLAKIKQTAI